MITGIYIENFKGVGEPGIKLDLEPVTLLFGGNSAGKSTIFHAVLLAYEVLVRGNRNPYKTELGGTAVDLGGFENFVHLHQMQRTIRLRFDLDLASVSLDRDWLIDERVANFKDIDFDLSKVGEDVWSASVELDLSWYEGDGSAFVSRYSVVLDGKQLGEIQDFRQVGGSVLLHFNPSHPVLGWTDEELGGSIGVLDYLIPGFRTAAEDRFVDAEPVLLDRVSELFDLNDPLQETISTQQGADVEADEEWQQRHNELHGLDDDDDESLPEDVIDQDDEDDGKESDDDTEGLPDTYVMELESLSSLRQQGDVEVRRYVHDHTSGLSFEAFIYRIETGHIGPLAVRFYRKDGWSRTDVTRAVRQWQEELGFHDEAVEREAHSLTLNSADALPNWYLPLDFDFQQKEKTEDEDLLDVSDVSLATQILSRLFLVPGRALRDALDFCRYIGPLREVPARTFVSPSSPDRSRWASGLAAWDYLMHCSEETLKEISDWLSREDRIGTRHEIVRRRVRQLPSDGVEIERLEGEDYLDDIERIRDVILSRNEIAKLKLHDTTLDVDIDPPDCAIGIAQLVPVVVAGVTSRDESDKRGMFMIEQPELHNHPSVEVGLGDLFTEAIHQKHCRFILETHGEHLMLRILRRIRETTEEELPEGVNGVMPEEVAVYFIECTKDGVSAKRLRIDETGEFIDRWPNGFFRERGKELF